LFLIAVFFLVKFQAKRIVTSLIESNSDGYVKVEIGGVNIHPSTRSLRIKSLFVLVKDHETKSYKKIKIDNAYLDVASLWNFFSGGTLVIEKLEMEGVELFIYNNHKSDTASNTFSLDKVLQNIKEDAIRFDIRGMVFKDVNLTLSKDTLKAPVAIKHLATRVQNLNLSAESSLNKKLLVEFGLPRQVIT
jgi:hypothetical protein